MATVNTMLGTVNVEDLGFTLMHEHIRESSAGVPQVFPDLFDHESDVIRCSDALNKAASNGVGTIVDVTTMDLGRDIKLMIDVANKVNMNIIPATGLWLDIPRAIANGCTVDQLAKSFVREIEEGIEGTHVKAGVIKVATDVQHIVDGKLVEHNELVLRAASRASIATGVPISTHTSSVAKIGNYQVAIFEDEGLKMDKVCIGHSNDTDDIGYLSGIVDKGCILGMDHFPGGRQGSLNWEQRVNVIKQLIDLGMADKITVSHDFGGWRPGLPELENARDTNNPDGYSFVSLNVVPRLLELGASQKDIDLITVENPRQFFDIS